MPTNQWEIGDVKITRILEGESAGPMFLLPDATKENIQAMPWLKPHFADEDGNCIISIHALVLDTPTKTIVVDTLTGREKSSVAGRSYTRSKSAMTLTLSQLTSSGLTI